MISCARYRHITQSYSLLPAPHLSCASLWSADQHTYPSYAHTWLAALDTLGNVFSAAFWEIVKGMGQVSVVPCGSLTADGVQNHSVLWAYA